MLSAIFECCGSWDQPGDFAVMHYDCVLKVPFGPFKAGERIPAIFVDFDSGVLETYDAKGAVTSTHTISAVLNN